MPRLSAIIIARNEAAHIGDCLDSVAFADERIVVDSESTDDTVAIARGKGALVSIHPFAGYGPQYNYALSLATGDWVLFIDADERVPPALAAEINAAIADGGTEAFRMPRLSTFCGRPMRHSGWYPDYILRLWRRGVARWSDDVVHARVIIEQPVGKLKQALLHYPVARLEDALSRMDRYSTANAEITAKSGRRVGFSTGIWHGLFAFFKAYVLRAGFLDGREGFLLAVAIAEGSYYRYMKAWLRTRDQIRDRVRDNG